MDHCHIVDRFSLSVYICHPWQLGRRIVRERRVFIMLKVISLVLAVLVVFSAGLSARSSDNYSFVKGYQVENGGYSSGYFKRGGDGSTVKRHFYNHNRRTTGVTETRFSYPQFNYPVF